MQKESQNVNNQITNRIASNMVDAIIYDLHSKARTTAGAKDTGDIFDELHGMGYKVNRITNSQIRNILERNDNNVSEALHLFLNEFINDYNKKREICIREAIERQIMNLKLNCTPNRHFMVNEEGVYYRFNGDKFVEDSNIVKIYDDGAYIKKEKIQGKDSDYLIIKYDIYDNIVSIKVTNGRNITYRNKEFVAKKLNFKQEVVNRFKLNGYSGNSSGLFAEFANKLFKPLPSGYYVDKKYNIYKWNALDGQFEKELRKNFKPGDPRISDYEIREKCVVRTDYNGKGLICR